jgi:hypothetical protein
MRIGHIGIWAYGHMTYGHMRVHSFGLTRKRQCAGQLRDAADQTDIRTRDHNRGDEETAESGRQAGIPGEVLPTDDDGDAERPDVVSF